MDFAEKGGIDYLLIDIDQQLACVVAIIDHLVHNAELNHIKGDAYRRKEAQECEEQHAIKRKATVRCNPEKLIISLPYGLTIGLAFMIDSNWTPEQALAVVELLNDIRERILLHYQLLRNEHEIT